ncbi:hypothetical protein PRZ48_011336 [Zasmidium cellare]|uniref:O-methyltransferase n=1 Tax=Zasmidium cellare TaxID=395010 RepID=A0ABR0E630_ZASCE|nr:hypothetical protein PRZ48_011336 [Zasmidium cellare]
MDLNASVQALTTALQSFPKTVSETARLETISKAKDLVFALQTPEQHVLQVSANAMELVAIRTVMRMGVLEVLPKEKETALELGVLAEKSGVQEALLERFLRLLVGTRFIQQDNAGRYWHSHVSKGYVDGGNAAAWLKGVVYDAVLEGFYQYPTAYLDAHPALKEPHDPTITPATFVWGKEGENTWQVMARDYPQKMLNFQRGMAMLVDAAPVTGVYDFSQLVKDGEKDRMVLVDVGGGTGHCVEAILKAHPDIPAERCMVQDLGHTIEHARQSETLPKGVQLLEHDFWTPQPVVHAKAYFMRWIVHDYVDSLSVKILKNIAAVMAKDSVVLIHEAIVPERLSEATMVAGIMDMFVLNCAGKERTKRGFETLLEQAGLVVRKYWQREGTAATMIEAVLV